jgi:hypothetical protein
VSTETDDGYNAEPLHDNCVICHAKSAKHENPGDETKVILLMMLKGDATAEEMYEDLCFFHRRLMNDLLETTPKVV